MKKTIFFATVLFSLNVSAQNLLIVTPKQTSTLTLIELKSKLKSYAVKIDDPVYKAMKEFDGFLLKDVLDLAGAEATEKADELVFATVDGYSPNVPIAALREHKAYVTYQEHGKPGRFGLVSAGKAKVSPWPYYLIWEEGAKIKVPVPWPYQLVKIEIVNYREKYPLVFPEKATADSSEMRGFQIFKAECIRCHSVNLQGGDLGPELNAPQNITEYWKTDVLKAFIKDNSQFRYKSKMPQFPKLSSSDLDDLMAYFKAMKDHKIKNP